MKKCLYCVEEIQDEAIKCRYCKKEICSSIVFDKATANQKEEPQNHATSKLTYILRLIRLSIIVSVVFIGMVIILLETNLD